VPPYIPSRVFLRPYLNKQTKKTQWPESASELYRLSDRRLLVKLVPTFAYRGSRVVNATDPHGLILGFLDRSRYFYFQVAPQPHEAEWTPFQTHSFSGNLVALGIEPRPLDL
jgi:hypothetical protein